MSPPPPASPETLPGWPGPGSPFHPGERELQERAGLRERMEQVGRKVVRGMMPAQHRELFAQLPWMLVGSLDAQQRPCASVLVGPPGFVHAQDERHLRIACLPRADEPLAAHLALGSPVGLLGLQLETRRRNRMNGAVAALDEQGFTVRVEQSFGNCPQYIQARTPRFVERPHLPAASWPEGTLLSEHARSLVAGADTLFIASAAAPVPGDASRGVDVSHRGGRSGFVRLSERDGQTLLTLPDYRGNFMFNTLGNLQLWPHASLLFIDFDRGDVLRLAGQTEIVWDGPEVATFPGAQRLLRVQVEAGTWQAGVLPLRWSAPEWAPQLRDA
ncbi:pyridoxamine 5'-phosphate oxidase family protein [Caldimonas brevitalea]|uniref:Pyridoxamine 5'-phosphate oxidase n=1 Tax=Caldimonas brevitalea TaxID=413882 RepID=A0A0G3BVZ7_9BURK|nr:pyridoxamine 5'-phosphate oxidase family protein [Caldimonas brevitalea]AKJ32203.1 pyridoxamine 5'-phosphate oxidase [Caldimonas brevitalea]